MWQLSEGAKGHKNNKDMQTKGKHRFPLGKGRFRTGGKKKMREQHLLQYSTFDLPDLVTFPILCRGMAACRPK